LLSFAEVVLWKLPLSKSLWLAVSILSTNRSPEPRAGLWPRRVRRHVSQRWGRFNWDLLHQADNCRGQNGIPTL